MGKKKPSSEIQVLIILAIIVYFFIVSNFSPLIFIFFLPLEKSLRSSLSSSQKWER